MSAQRRSRGWHGWWGIVAVALVLLMAGTASANAPAGTVVASGLVNPRGLAVADDGTIYVAETGAGGTEALPTSPQPGPPGQRRGTSGQVTRSRRAARNRSLPVACPPSAAGRGRTA